MALLHFGIFHSNSDLGLRRGLRQVHLDALAGRLDVADVHHARERRGPEPGDRPAAGVERQVVLPVEPARRHRPAVRCRRSRASAAAGSSSGSTDAAGRPGCPSGSFLTNVSSFGPVVVERVPEQDADAEVDLDQVVGDQLAVHHDARGDEHLVAPVGHVLVGVVADVRVVERAPAAEQHAAVADLLVAGQRLVEEVEQVVVQRHDTSS